MVSKRRQARRQKREREAENQQRVLIIAGAVIVVVIAIVVIATTAGKGDRLPRANRVSAATLTSKDGQDPCPLFPQYAGTETQPPALAIDKGKDYAAWIVTAKGEIVADLFANVAPETVNNFMFLACNHFYDGLTFHRVLPGFVAQGGDPKGDGSGGPPYTIPDEFKLSDLKFDKAGLLSMAHTGQPNSAGSQFFITYAPTPNLDGSFTIFGEVVKGMDVAQQITPRNPDNPEDLKITPDKIVTIIVRQVSP